MSFGNPALRLPLMRTTRFEGKERNAMKPIWEQSDDIRIAAAQERMQQSVLPLFTGRD